MMIPAGGNQGNKDPYLILLQFLPPFDAYGRSASWVGHGEGWRIDLGGEMENIYRTCLFLYLIANVSKLLYPLLIIIMIATHY